MNNQSTSKLAKYRIAVDQNKCIAAASCVAVAPDTFELNDEDKAQIKPNSSETEETKLLAAQSCPVGAITVIDQKTGEQIWPLEGKL